jgi:hypothetical protein
MQALRKCKTEVVLSLGVLVVIALTAGAVYAKGKTVYVTVNSAKLREGTEAGQSKAVAYVPYGDPLEVLEENENYYRAKWVDKVGWVHKSQVGDKKPKKEVQGKSRSNLSQMTGSQASASASGRGLMEGKKYADAKGLTKEYKLVEWIETLAPTQDALDAFQQEGKLGPYQGEK